jgi:diguanylate cyclase (GGDEF)-like protein
LPLLVPVVMAGAGVLAAAVSSFAASQPSIEMLAGVGALLAASMLAEAFPVPVESLPAGYVALAAVFVVATGLVYGWAPAAIVAFLTRATLEVIQRRPPIRLAYNSAVYTIAGAAAGGAIALAPEASDVLHLLFAVALGAGAFYFVNVLLVAAVIARWAGEPFLPLLRTSALYTSVPFAIMASASLMLAVLWERSPLLSIALVGPLLAIALYQRSVHAAFEAVRLALTDALTGLGNHRHFHERLERELEEAETSGTPLTLCLLDVDDLKAINDRFGHPVGDTVLEAVASELRSGGEAFRIGGDEFAVLLPRMSELEGLDVARSIIARLGQVEAPDGEPITMSAGVAVFPRHGIKRSELYRVTDAALYRAKRGGKNQVRAYRGEEEPTPLKPAAIA